MEPQMSIVSALDPGVQHNSGGPNGEVMDWLNTNLESVWNASPLPLTYNASSSNGMFAGVEGREWNECSPRSISRARKEAGQSLTIGETANKNSVAAMSQHNLLFSSVADVGRGQQEFLSTMGGAGVMAPHSALFLQQDNDATTSLGASSHKECLLENEMNQSQSPPTSSRSQAETDHTPMRILRPTVQVSKSKRSRGAPKKHQKPTSCSDSTAVNTAVALGTCLGSSSPIMSAEERRRVRAARNRESAEKSRLRRKQYTDDLEREVGSLREANKMLKGRAMLLTMTLQKVDADVDSAISNGLIRSSQTPLNGSALKRALMALGDARMQCPVTFGEATDRPETVPASTSL
jgi:bZIP transcription factor